MQTRSQPFLRFTGSATHDPAIREWLGALPQDLGSIASTWWLLMRRCGSDVRELMHDGCPTACVEDAPFAYVNAFRSHVNVGFFHGNALNDPAGLLEGKGKFMRHVKLRPGLAIDPAPLEALITDAHLDIVTRLKEAG